jgi:hypothetical protein
MNGIEAKKYALQLDRKMNEMEQKKDSEWTQSDVLQYKQMLDELKIICFLYMPIGKTPKEWLNEG